MVPAPRAGAHTESRFGRQIQVKSTKNVALHFRENTTPHPTKSMTYTTTNHANCRRWVYVGGIHALALVEARLPMDAILGWIESSELSQWVRSDCLCAFPAITTIHTICMGLLAGGSSAIDLRILGFAQGIPLEHTRGFLPVLWAAFVVNAVTGT